MLVLSLEIVCIALGVFFMFVASFGVLRLPDFYARVHAPTKASTLGLFFLLISVALVIPEKDVMTKALLALLFIGATAPVGAHILTRAAYRSGVPLPPDTELDEYAQAAQRARTEGRGRDPVRAHDLDAPAPPH